MRTFFYTGRNAANRSGLSWKRWQIRREGRVVISEWGPVRIERRRLQFIYRQSSTRRFRSEAAAIAHVGEKVREKMRKGYQTKPRKRAVSG